MKHLLSHLEPKSLWRNFESLNRVPRASKKEEKVIAFMVAYGKSLSLETLVDEVGNVVIKKPATKGYENRKIVVLQSHLDMVHQKNSDTIFDFETQGIDMYIDQDWVKANGTTLGADNGIGVATAMAILESTDVAHPTIEALFTIDEETGMTGAKLLDPKILSGSIMLNLDTEEDNALDIGCAGGVDVTGNGKYTPTTIEGKTKGMLLKLSGLQGGHSGMDIHKGYGNANKLMNRLLFELNAQVNIKIASINGGGLRNAIPRESKTVLAISDDQWTQVKNNTESIFDYILSEYKSLEEDIHLSIEPTDTPIHVMDSKSQANLLNAIYAIHNGVYRMSPDMADLVETSNNLARVIVANGTIEIACLTRSSVESSKLDLVNQLKSALLLAGFDIKTSGDYPGWAPNRDSEILSLTARVYEDLFHEKPHIEACHAGLECGIIKKRYPHMDMVSFGPNIEGAHSPDEKVQISSVQKYWRFFLQVLKEFPTKK